MKPRIAVAALIASLAVIGLFALPASAAAPVLVVESISNVSYTSAEVTGKSVFDTEANGGSDGYRFFQWCHPASPGECTETGGSWNNGPEAFGHVQSAGSEETVEEQLTGLPAGAEVVVRMIALPFSGGEIFSAEPYDSFKTNTVAKPTIVVPLDVSAITSETAHFSTEIDPGGSGDEAFNTEWTISCEPQPCLDANHHQLAGTVPAGAPQPISAEATGLEPNTPYTVKLTAKNAGGEVEETLANPFTTGGVKPAVIAFAAGPVQSDQVDLNGEVDPRNSPTTYWFEWGTADCSANPCQKTASQGAGEGPYYRWAEARLTGLSAETTYHFRLVAENERGPVVGPDEEFTTAAPQSACPNQGQLGTNILPDCRAWEMVSPPDKNGINVITQSDKTHISTDGNAVTYSALGTFGEVDGSSFDTEYLARRTATPGTNGWTTHGINPLGRPTTAEATAGNTSTYENGFTPDLSAGVYETWRPLTGDAQNVEDFSTLYRVSGIADGGPGSIELLSKAVAPVEPQPSPFGPRGSFVKLIGPMFDGASTDLSRVFFEESLPLTADAPLPAEPFAFYCTTYAAFCPHTLYENSNDQVHLVGRIPAEGETFCDEASGPACVAAPNSQAALERTEQRWSERTISADGRRIYFEAPIGSGALYLREDGERTYEVTKSGEFGDASRDGSRVFFISEENLLPEDSDGQPDLYMWDRSAAAGERLSLLSVGPSGESCYSYFVVGASANGHYAYFVCQGKPVPGQPEAFLGLFVWHDGRLAYIGTGGDLGDARANSFRNSWALVEGIRKARVSPDGRHLLFVARNNKGLQGRGGFSGYQNESNVQELYLYNAETGRLACATCNPSGEPPKSSPLIDVRVNAATSRATADSVHALSDDGRYVFFSSEEALVPEDTNGTWDAYEYDSRAGQLHLLSSGTDPSPSYVIDATDDGHDVFIATRQRLSAWDKDNLYDLYDARVNGGLPEPSPVPAPCVGDSCRPSPTGAPTAPAIGSKAGGPGNPPRHCPKHVRVSRRHGRLVCTKRHRHHRKRHHRRTKHDGRAGR
ncbi:MAG TPA: hypothetical protein VFN85_05295 [Solirubrobacterales bacterium]|nr:hypothetical protein [Solirubrobacterales bacterium]